MEDGFVSDGESVVSGGDGAVALESVYYVFWRVAALPGGQDQGQHLLALFTSQVDLRGQPAAGASQRVGVWFCRETTGGLLLLAGVS